jgi:hypothetical protein
MTPEQGKSIHRRFLTNRAAIRRFTGPAGPNRTATDVEVHAWVKRFRAGPGTGALVSDVMQADYAAVVLVEDLVAAGFALPITTADKLVFNGKEFAISFPDSATRTVGTELVAYNLMVKG